MGFFWKKFVTLYRNINFISGGTTMGKTISLPWLCNSRKPLSAGESKSRMELDLSVLTSASPLTCSSIISSASKFESMCCSILLIYELISLKVVPTKLPKKFILFFSTLLNYLFTINGREKYNASNINLLCRKNIFITHQSIA